MHSRHWTNIVSALFFFFSTTATPSIYPLSLHDALPISPISIDSSTPEALEAALPAYVGKALVNSVTGEDEVLERLLPLVDRKSTRLNSSHSSISYAVFCLKKKKNILQNPNLRPTLSSPP